MFRHDGWAGCITQEQSTCLAYVMLLDTANLQCKKYYTAKKKLQRNKISDNFEITLEHDYVVIQLPDEGG